jgi:DNA-binding NarL/FixJ family response regulator
VLLCDDQRLIRARVRELLKEVAFIQIVGEAADGRSAVTMALELKPDVVLMDVAMPGLDGVEATHQIVTQSPGIRVLAFSADSSAESMKRMFAAGAGGYLVKTGDPVELVIAVQNVLRGKRFVSARADGPRVPSRHD